jgi:hypothetical protein
MQRKYKISRNVKFQTQLFLLYIIFTMSVTIFIPLTISWDGVLYIASGKSLFTSNFPSWYLSMKEPGYAFLVWLSLYFGNSLFGLVIIQAILLGISGVMLHKIVNQKFKLTNKTTTVIVMLGILLVRGYASSVLQQTLFLFFYVLGMFLVYRINEMKNLKVMMLFFFTYGMFGASTSMIIPAIFVLTILLAVIFQNIEFKKAILIVTSILLGVVTFAAPWFSTTSSIDQTKQITPSCASTLCISGFKPNANWLEKSNQIAASIPALLYISNETYFSQNSKTFIAQTSLAYGNPLFNIGTDCIRLQENDVRVYNLISKDIKSFCPNQDVRKIQNAVSSVLTPFFPLFGYSYLFLLSVAILKRKKEFIPVMSILAATVIAYALNGTGISRYNPLLAFCGPFFFYILWKELLQKQSNLSLHKLKPAKSKK